MASYCKRTMLLTGKTDPGCLVHVDSAPYFTVPGVEGKTCTYDLHDLEVTGTSEDWGRKPKLHSDARSQHTRRA